MSENKTNPSAVADDDNEALIRRAMAKIAENAPPASEGLQKRMLSELGIEGGTAPEPKPGKDN